MDIDYDEIKELALKAAEFRYWLEGMLQDIVDILGAELEWDYESNEWAIVTDKKVPEDVKQFVENKVRYVHFVENVELE